MVSALPRRFSVIISMVQLAVYYAIGWASVIGASITGYMMSIRRGWEVPRWLLITAIVIVPAMLLSAQVLQYASLHFYTDFSHWLDILLGIMKTGRPLSFTVELQTPGRYNYFSSHFVPFIYLVALPFSVLPFPSTIMVFNVLVMTSAAIPLYLLTRRMGGSARFAMFVAVLFLWYPTFQYITMYEFEMLRFSMPALFWMLYFWERRSLASMLLCALLASFVREEVGLTVAMFGLFLALVERRRVLGFATFTIGLGVFFFILQVAMPLFWGGERFVHGTLPLFGAGSTPLAVVAGILRHPLVLLGSIAQPEKIANLSMLFLPLLFLPFLAPGALLPVVASFGIGLLSTSPVHSSYMLYYMAPSVPFIFYAFLRGWPRGIAWLKGLMESGIPERSHRVVSSAMAAALIGLLMTNMFFGPSPLAFQFWSNGLRPAPFRTHSYHWSAYRVTDHHRKVDAFVRLIPDDAIVSAEQFLASRLFRKRGVMSFPQLESADEKYKADYVFIDKANPIKTGIATVPGSWNGLRENPQFYYDWIEKSPQQWEPVRADDGYALYRRRM